MVTNLLAFGTQSNFWSVMDCMIDTNGLSMEEVWTLQSYSKMDGAKLSDYPKNIGFQGIMFSSRRLDKVSCSFPNRVPGKR